MLLRDLLTMICKLRVLQTGMENTYFDMKQAKDKK